MHSKFTFLYHSFLLDFILLFYTSGIYSPNAYRGFAREFIKDLERIRSLPLTLFQQQLVSHGLSDSASSCFCEIPLDALNYFHWLVHCRPRAILDIITSGENFRISTSAKMPEQGTCERCGYISSQVSSAFICVESWEIFEEMQEY